MITCCEDCITMCYFCKYYVQFEEEELDQQEEFYTDYYYDGECMKCGDLVESGEVCSNFYCILVDEETRNNVR